MKIRESIKEEDKRRDEEGDRGWRETKDKGQSEQEEMIDFTRTSTRSYCRKNKV